jgi:UV DNA damage endonuclease
MTDEPFRIGYACISLPMREQGIFCSRTLTLKTLTERGKALAIERAAANVADLDRIVRYNEAHGLRFFRITSNLFPHWHNEKAGELGEYDIDFAAARLRETGDYAKTHKHRITAHPGQYCQLGTPHADVLERTVRDLANHAETFQRMGLEPADGACMILHAGGKYGDKQATLERWRTNYNALPAEIKKYIVLENDDYHYHAMDLLPTCEQLGVPLCADYFHHQCYGAEHFDIYTPDITSRIVATWRGTTPKCHISQQRPGARKGTHDDYVDEIPAQLLAICREHNIDVMAECKAKDLCALRLYHKYFDEVTDDDTVRWRIK